jgi:hypothetical protein
MKATTADFWSPPRRNQTIRRGEVPLDTQLALLRVLQERQFERVGGKMPALLTKTSTRQNAASTAASRRATSAVFDTSAPTTIASPPPRVVSLNDPFGAVSVARIVHSDARASRRECLRNPAADAVGGTGHDSHSSCQSARVRAPQVRSQSASQHLFDTTRKKQRSGTRAMSIDRHRVDTSTQASGELEMNYSIAGESTLAEDDVCDHDETEVRRDHHRHPPGWAVACEAVV